MEKHILIIEDEPDIREAMAEAIVDAGFKVTSAANGADGLKMAIAEQPDLILLDIIMPVMDGHETLKRLRQDPWGQSVKVVMLTSMDDVGNIANAHEGSITDYLIKTQNSLDEIVKKVREALYVD